MKRKPPFKAPQRKHTQRPDWFFLAVIMVVLILLAVSLNWFFSS